MITAAQVQAAVLSKQITKIDHHRCSLCNHMVYYLVIGGELFFNPGCDCKWEDPEPRDWQDAANFINMQTNEIIRSQLMKQWGFGI
jgi:hypothetical protein